MKSRLLRHPFMKTGLFYFILFVILFVPKDARAQQANLPSYSVKSTSTPYKGQFKNFSTYNSRTKQYYTLRSYLEQLEKSGGGTLTLTKGTYNITNTLYIPSRVTLIMKDGVVLKKGDTTGLKKILPSKSIIQLIAPSKSGKKGAVSSYQGETGINIIGEGSATIDLNYSEDTIGIIFGHDTDISVTGITFQNMKGGHFIELDASQKVTISDCRFFNHKPSSTGIKEAINIDTPDRTTGGFHELWTSYDCTPDKDIVIQNNTFAHLERAIGTHKYSEGKYHENVQIIHNKITDTDSDAIRILNWTKPVIKDNEIRMVAGGSMNGSFRAILASGVKDPVITGNTFADAARPIQIMPWKNSGPGSQYAITYNEITKDNITQMLQNTLIQVGEEFIRINNSYNVYDRDTDRYYFGNNTNEDEND